MSERMKRSLRNEIMNLHSPMLANPVDKLEAYKIGYRDARHDAAELSAEHEAIESALVEALEGLMELESRGRVMPIGPEWDAARKALALAYGETQ